MLYQSELTSSARLLMTSVMVVGQPVSELSIVAIGEVGPSPVKAFIRAMLSCWGDGD